MDDNREKADFERELLAAYSDLQRYAERLSGNRAEARDLVQDTMERALRGRGRFRQGTATYSWLATILRRIFIDRCRHSKVAAQLSLSGDLTGFAAPEEGPRPAAPWEAFSIEDVWRASMLLAPCFRAPYAMFAFERLSYAEIGNRLSMPPGTVATRVFRARQRLRDLLESGEFRQRPTPSPVPSARAARLRAAQHADYVVRSLYLDDGSEDAPLREAGGR